MATVEQRSGGEAAEPSPVALLDDAPSRLLAPAEAEQLVLRVLGQHADALLRTARKHSLNADDAQDAYQRGVEIFLKHVRRLEPERAHSWLHTVVKHEAMLVRRTRQRDVAPEDVDFDLRESEHVSDPADALVRLDRVERSAAALRQLKPQEVQALWLKATGYSYEEIAERQSWTRTKVMCQVGPTFGWFFRTPLRLRTTLLEVVSATPRLPRPRRGTRTERSRRRSVSTRTGSAPDSVTPGPGFVLPACAV